MLIFVEGGKPEYPEKNPRSSPETRTNNKLNPHMTPRPGIEPGPHWWEVRAATAPSLLPYDRRLVAFSSFVLHKMTDLENSV